MEKYISLPIAISYYKLSKIFKMKFVLIRLTVAWYINETREDGQLICKYHRIIGILLTY